MFLIIDFNDVVMDCTENLTYLENGNPCVDEVLAYDKSIVKSVLEVDAIPTDFAKGKYKYTTANGFTLNENWVDPNDAVDPKALKEENAALKQKIDLIQKALDELLLGGM
jgi:hypothetical protein